MSETPERQKVLTIVYHGSQSINQSVDQSIDQYFVFLISYLTIAAKSLSCHKYLSFSFYSQVKTTGKRTETPLTSSLN